MPQWPKSGHHVKATYTPTSNRAGSRSLSITRSPAQESACKDLERNDQSPAITLKATYTPIPKRAGSRSLCLLT
ncbi:alpha-galactosidase [Lacticaseibacillus rhamnosus]|nr:alpha-galactosidase [Lacticaseibacillus rhamnosus]